MEMKLVLFETLYLYIVLVVLLCMKWNMIWCGVCVFVLATKQLTVMLLNRFRI